MKSTLLAVAVTAALTLGACKNAEDTSATDTATTTEQASGSVDATQAPETTATTPEAAPVDEADTAADEDNDEAAAERKERQSKLDYASMEDGYLNDTNGQWATSATASSSFGNANEKPADSHDPSTPWQATGAPNGDAWQNDNQDVGFDWIQLKYANAVTPSEVRAVVHGNEAIEAITKVELIDTTGQSHVLWSGLSDAKQDKRGPRTWYVTPAKDADYMTDTVKLTFANNVASGYKEVDAVQLVGK